MVDRNIPSHFSLTSEGFRTIFFVIYDKEKGVFPVMKQVKKKDLSHSAAKFDQI